jgi:hypothetical protein
MATEVQRATWWGYGKRVPQGSGRGFGRPGRVRGGQVVVRQQSGNGGGGRAVPVAALPRLAARADARRWAAYVAGWGDTPTPAEARWCVLRVFAACAPGAGRAPTTAG